MARVLTKQRLERENLAYRYTGGVSQGNRCSGFAPAFRDNETGLVYSSLKACGDPAPYHCLEGLPAVLVFGVDPVSGSRMIKASVEAGFVRDGEFFTRSQAADCVSMED